MSLNTNNSQWRALKATLDTIVTDEDDGSSDEFMSAVYSVERTTEAYVDDVETAGPDLAYEISEGEEAPEGDFLEGPMTRYMVRKFGLTMRVSEEALEDGKYKNYIAPAQRCKRAMNKTRSIDAANIFNRVTDTNYVFGDGQPLASTSHTLPSGGTFSNRLGTLATPSRAALTQITDNVLMLPGHDGNVGDGIMPATIVGHLTQWSVWDGILMSTGVPESANNEINVVNRNSIGLKLKFAGSPFITSTSFWGVVTDAPVGFRWLNRKMPTSNTYTDEGGDVMVFKIKARWARGNSDPGRSFYLGNT